MQVEWTGETGFLSLYRMATQHAPKYLFAFFVPLVLTLLFTPLVRRLVIRLGMIDKPDPRRINTRPVPRGGGLAIFLAFHATLFGLYACFGAEICNKVSPGMFLSFLIASGILTVIGFLDDKFSLPPLLKLFGQIAVANIIYFSGFTIDGIFVDFPVWLDYGITCFWIIGAINAFNLIDGMDGLASGLTMIASFGMAGALLFSNDVTSIIPYLIVAGACIGFLRYNFHPASIFLGDTGSMFLGLSMAVFPLATGARKELVASFGVPLLIIGIPIFDTFLAIWRRSVKRLLPKSMADNLTADGIMQPDRNHIHHRVLRMFMNNQRKAAFVLYCTAGLLVLLGLGGIMLSGRAPGLYFIAFVIVTTVVVKNMECMEIIDTCKLVSSEHIAKNRKLTVLFRIIIDAIILGSSCICAWLISIDIPITSRSILKLILVYVAPTMIAFAGCNIYRRVWSRARLTDYITLAFAVFFGATSSMGILWLEHGSTYHLLRFSLTFGCLALIGLAGNRFFRQCMFAIAAILVKRTQTENSECEKILLYGAGMRMRSYLTEMFESTSGFIPSKKANIIGLIDDNPLLRGQMVAGFNILGSAGNLKEIVRQRKIDKVVITCDMPRERIRKIAESLAEENTKVTHWFCEEQIVQQ